MGIGRGEEAERLNDVARKITFAARRKIKKPRKNRGKKKSTTEVCGAQEQIALRLLALL